jgi:hypothetical protein
MAQSKITPETPGAPPVNGSAVGHTGQAANSTFDLSEFRLDQNFGLRTQAQRKVVVVPVARPDKQQWVAIHPDPAWRVYVNLFEDKANRRTYLVAPDIAPEVTEDLVSKVLVSYVTRTGSPGLWPIRLPDDGGRLDTFNESALNIVAEYAGQWVRVLVDQAEKSYSVMSSPPMEIPAPKWPDGGFAWMCETAFKNRIIRSLDHPALVALRGGMLGV